MMDCTLWIAVVLVIIVLLVCSGWMGKMTVENWQNYQMCPYGEVRTGQDPLYFYAYYRYRQPYRWPFRYYSSYPYPHLQPFP